MHPFFPDGRVQSRDNNSRYETSAFCVCTSELVARSIVSIPILVWNIRTAYSGFPMCSVNLFSSKISQDRIKRVEVVEFKAEFVRDAILGKNFGNKSVTCNAAHRANMDAPRERFFIPDNKRCPVARRTCVPYLAGYPIGPSMSVSYHANPSAVQR